MWLTTKEAAEKLGISERAVRKRVKSGKMVARWVEGQKGGRSGKVLLVWVGEPSPQSPPASGRGSKIGDAPTIERGRKMIEEPLRNRLGNFE